MSSAWNVWWHDAFFSIDTIKYFKWLDTISFPDMGKRILNLKILDTRLYNYDKTLKNPPNTSYLHPTYWWSVSPSRPPRTSGQSESTDRPSATRFVVGARRSCYRVSWPWILLFLSADELPSLSLGVLVERWIQVTYCLKHNYSVLHPHYSKASINRHWTTNKVLNIEVQNSWNDLLKCIISLQIEDFDFVISI